MARQAPIGRPIYIGEMQTVVDVIKRSGGEIIATNEIYSASGIASGVSVDVIHWRRNGVNRLAIAGWHGYGDSSHSHATFVCEGGRVTVAAVVRLLRYIGVYAAVLRSQLPAIRDALA